MTTDEVGSLRVVPLSEELLAPVTAPCTAGLRRLAARVGQSLLRPPATPAEQLVEAVLRRQLEPAAGSESRHGWVVLDRDGTVQACAGTVAMDLTPDDPRYTYLPPRSVTVTITTTHAESDTAVDGCYPLLLEAVRQVASERDAHLLVHMVAEDTAAAAWQRLRLRLGTVMARRSASGWRSPGAAPDGLAIRVAGTGDIPALTDLALAEHHYHAALPGSAVSPDQPRATSEQVAADNVAAPPETSHQLVAVDGDGRVVGSIHGTIQEFADDQIQRYLLPPRYGYVGLTSVTEPARGTGVGRALIDSLMGWFAARDVEPVFLHCQVDNPLSSRFWTRSGFVPHLEIYSDPGRVIR